MFRYVYYKCDSGCFLAKERYTLTVVVGLQNSDKNDLAELGKLKATCQYSPYYDSPEIGIIKSYHLWMKSFLDAGKSLVTVKIFSHGKHLPRDRRR